MAGAQYAMTLRKCEPDMATYAERWNLRDCIVDYSESWLKEFIGSRLLFVTGYWNQYHCNEQIWLVQLH